ncbi:MAG TPA: hypothetical protein VMG12_16085 [Polyangiaceae bacterium]|nr:hypothetical protein [Polyangiaceae bacterium]
MRSKRWRAALHAARGGLLLGGGVWCCSLYEGRTLEFFPDAQTPSVECRVESDCRGDRKHCAGGACRECLVDGDCGKGKPACVGNVCVECRAGVDCPDGQSCNPVLLTCAFTCSDTSQCAGQPTSRCSSELDLCVQCLDDEHCDPAHPACDMGGHCVECTESQHCTTPDRPSCDSASRTCVECTDSSECDGRVCDPKAHRCVECLADADCGAGTCDVGPKPRCREPCTRNEDCDPKRPVCDATTGQCMECGTREQCKGAKRKACTVEHECVECLTDDDCTEPGKRACLDTKQLCGECKGDEYCGEGERCELAAARCVPVPPLPAEPAPDEPEPGGPPDPMPGPDRPDAGGPPGPGP